MATQRELIGTREWHEAEDILDRIEYEQAGEPDGCYWCGSSHHKTSDCHASRNDGPPYDAATATGMYDAW